MNPHRYAFLMLAAVPSAALSYEPAVSEQPVATATFKESAGGTRYWAIDDWKEIHVEKLEELGVALRIPIYLSARETRLRCAKEAGSMTLVRLTGGELDMDDGPGVTDVVVRYTPRTGLIELDVVARPFIDNIRTTQPISYHYPVLDTVSTNLCTPGQSYQMDLSVYMNGYNLVFVGTQPGAPLARTYVSPVNTGMGTAFLRALAQRARGKLKIWGDVAGETAPSLTSFSWPRFKDDFNLYYGGLSVPFTGLLRDRGSGAPGTLLMLLTPFRPAMIGPPLAG